MQLSDRVTGLFLIALGGVSAYAGSRLPPVPGQQIGPNVFPMVVGVGLCLCGGLIAFGIGRHYEEEAEADLAAVSGQPVEPPGALGWLRGLMALVPPGLLLFYVYAAERLGFLLTAAIIIVTAALALGARLRLAIPLALGAPFIVHLIFAKLLRVPLPWGLVPPPW